MNYQEAARKKLGLSPLEETALMASSKETLPAGFSKGPVADEVRKNELLGKLLGG